MDFATIFDTFVNWQTLVFCLGIYLITLVIRTFLETFWQKAKENRFYRELFLPLGAIVNGAIIGAIAHKFPWPAPGLTSSLLARCMYGAICGLVSSWVYGRFKSWINSGKPVLPASPTQTPASMEDDQSNQV